MNFICYLGRSVFGQVLTTYQREDARIERTFGRDSKRPFLAKLVNNKMIQAALIHCLLAWTIYMIFGWRGLAHQMMYALTGVVWLEIENYTQHYGLTRLKDEDGVYESINRFHSWNAPGSRMMFRIQRHSDHHIHAFRPYQLLRKLDDAPQLPFSYVGTLFILLCPPLWFALMNPRVDAI